MPLDAVYLSQVQRELSDSLINARIDKIYQPTRTDIVIAVRTATGNQKLLLSANPSHPRICFTNASYENPAAPPMLCMLMRKHFSGGKITEIEQPHMDRLLDIFVEGTNEFGDFVTRHIVLELTGRNSNLVILNQDGRIIDCVKRVDYEMSEERQILPGLFYERPPIQNKILPQDCSMDRIIPLMESVDHSVRPDEFILSNFAGISPLIARELAFEYKKDDFDDLYRLSGAERYAFCAYLGNALKKLYAEHANPCILYKNGVLWDYSYMPILQYGSLVESRPYENFNGLLDYFYYSKDHQERLQSKAQALIKNVTTLRNRTRKKIALQQKELTATEKRDFYRICGELITANIYRINRGDTSVEAENYYDPELKPIKIELKPNLSPQQNAAKYFKDYNKAKNAEKVLAELIEKETAELDYLESVLDELSRIDSEKDIEEIQAELTDEGYLRRDAKSRKAKKGTLRPREYVSSAGYRIRVGKNNTQNDYLTLKDSFKSDIWLHTQKIHGSHVIISCDGKQPDETTLIEAAKLAAYYSRAKSSSNVPVDYTNVKNVKKPNGARAGMVIYNFYNTLYVDPDISGIQEITENHRS